MYLRISLALVCLLVSTAAFAKGADAKKDQRKPSSARACRLEFNNGWELWVGDNLYFGLNTSSTGQERLLISEMARNLAQAGACQF